MFTTGQQLQSAQPMHALCAYKLFGAVDNVLGDAAGLNLVERDECDTSLQLAILQQELS